MSTRWTTNQEQAIKVRNTNTLVSAAAGSGKTAVLVERVIGIITDENNPVNINNLLVATFTNTAASEMKERIYKAIQDKLNANPTNTHLRQQLVLLGQAQITTVHAFCINVLRENFHHLGIRHDFEIGDEIKLKTLQNTVIDDLFEEKYSSKDAGFLHLVDTFGGNRSDNDLVDIILKLSKFSEAVAYPEQWLLNNTKMPEDISIYKMYALGEFEQMLHKAVADYTAAIEYIKEDESITPYLPVYCEELDYFKDLIDHFDDREYLENQIKGFGFKTLPRKNSKCLEIHIDAVKNIRESTKKAYNSHAVLALYTDKDILDEFKEMLSFTKPLCELTVEFRNKYAQAKLMENILDFSDLEHFTIKLLDENEEVRNHYRQTFAEIFVDEYQDTNAVQARLFELLSRGNNLFMVGDVKQSIYCFRNSNPAFFMEKYNMFDIDGNENGRKILFSHNFRSTNGILSFVNSVFRKMMSEAVGGVDYNDDHALTYGNDKMTDLNTSSEVCVIDHKTIGSADIDDASIMDKTQLEAIFVADSIINLVENERPQIFDKKLDKYRTVEYRDIAILMRKIKGVATVYADVFAKRGIPVYTEESGGFFNSIEIATVMSFLKIIENPLQDIPMLAVMRSPLYGFDDNTIANMRAGNLDESIYTTLHKSADSRASRLLTDIRNLSDLARFNDVEYILRKIIYDTGYYQFVGGLPDGDRRMANLRLLCERAYDFESTGFKSLLRFIRYIEDMLAGGYEYSSAKMLSESDNVVSIMTIHKSKGLEFPVVYLANCGAEFNKTDLSKTCLFDADLGVSTDVIDTKRRLKYTPYVKRAFKNKKEQELISEEVRLLYVALTRAKYRLVVTATLANAFSAFSKLNSQPAVAGTFMAERTYIHWLSNVLDAKSVKLYSAEDVLTADENITVKRTLFDVEDGDYSEFYDEIDNRLGFEYKFAECKFVPSKKSISEIADTVDETIRFATISMRDKGITPAQKGTVIHFVLQNIDLENVGSEQSVASQIDKMVANGMLEKELADIVDCNAIYEFFVSETGRRMLASDTVYREFKFCVDIPSQDLGYKATDEKVLVQGVIDCCFIEDDEFVIIDYKTGSLQEKYKLQLDMYAKCLNLATGKNVKETCIYPLI